MRGERGVNAASFHDPDRQEHETGGSDHRAGNPHRERGAVSRSFRAAVARRSRTGIGEAERDRSDDQGASNRSHDDSPPDESARLDRVGAIDERIIGGRRIVAVEVLEVLEVLEVGFGFGFGFGYGYGVGLGYGVGVGLGLGLGFGLGLGYGVRVGLGYGVRVGLGYGVGYGVRVGLGYGVGVGLGVGLGLGFGLGLGVGFGFGFGFGLARVHRGCLAYGLGGMDRSRANRARPQEGDDEAQPGAARCVVRPLRSSPREPVACTSHGCVGPKPTTSLAIGCARVQARSCMLVAPAGCRRTHARRRSRKRAFFHGLLGAWVFVAATTVQAAAPIDDASFYSCAHDPGASFVLGPVDAPVVVEAFIDPIDPRSLATWLELRRLVSDLRGSTAFAVHLVRGLGPTEPRADEVRAWIAAAAHRGHLLAALRQVARDGEERLFLRLHAQEERSALIRELGAATTLVDDAEALRCGWAHIRAANRTLSMRHAGGRGIAFRLPLFMLDELSFEDSPALERLRWELGKQALRLREARQRLPPPIPQPRAASERMRRPPLHGSLLGGSGLPHRFVLMARDEDDPHLVMLLPPVLDYRRDHPSRLAVHIVARGTSIGGQRLRHRLCAARHLGLDLEYARFLATDPASRRFPMPTHEALLERLDAVPEGTCADEPDPADLGLPDGGWLDGVPRNRSELESIDATLNLLDAANRPLSPILAPATDSDL
jgi:hypothetical protein